jgi:hypothetical protein
MCSLTTEFFIVEFHSIINCQSWFNDSCSNANEFAFLKSKNTSDFFQITLSYINLHGYPYNYKKGTNKSHPAKFIITKYQYMFVVCL